LRASRAWSAISTTPSPSTPACSADASRPPIYLFRYKAGFSLRNSAAFSPMITQGAIVFPVVTRGTIEPSAMRRLSRCRDVAQVLRCPAIHDPADICPGCANGRHCAVASLPASRNATPDSRQTTKEATFVFSLSLRQHGFAFYRARRSINSMTYPDHQGQARQARLPSRLHNRDQWPEPHANSMVYMLSYILRGMLVVPRRRRAGI
jgi:hypothetical protein